MTDTQVAEFGKRVKDIEAAYKSARIRTLLADRGNGLVPCITRIHLLANEPNKNVIDVWSSRTISVIECVVEYNGIDSLIQSITTKGMELNYVRLGFDQLESPNWHYNVHFRDERIEGSLAESTTLKLRGAIQREKLPDEFYNRLQDEIRLHKTLPFPSHRELTEKFFGFAEGNIDLNLIDIVAPSHVRIVSLDYLGSDIVVRFTCMKETVDNMRIKAMFSLSDGGFWPYSPRLRKSPVLTLPDGSVEVTKTFSVPSAAANSSGVDVTLSLKGESGLDTMFAFNLEIVNLPWFTFRLLDPSKVNTHFELKDFELRLALLKNAGVFEAMIASLLTACGLRVAWTGGFSLSCEDMFAFDNMNRIVLVCECTVGSPRHKIGLMKSALTSLSRHSHHIRFVGVVFTAQATSDPERQGAAKDHVIIRDASDIKTLVQLASEAPDERLVYSWLGIDL